MHTCDLKSPQEVVSNLISKDVSQSECFNLHLPTQVTYQTVQNFTCNATRAPLTSLYSARIAWFMKLNQHFKFYYRRNGEQHSINIALELWGCPVGLNEKCTGCNKKGNIRRPISQHHRKWVHNLQCQRKIKNLKNINTEHKEWKSWSLWWHYHGNQSRYVTTGQLWVDIGKISLNTQI